MNRFTPTLLAISLLFACQTVEVAPERPESDLVLEERLYNPFITAVDILFVVSTSPSMEPLDERVAAQVEAMVRAIVALPDESCPEFKDLHFGVISADVGAGGYDLGGSCTSDGDDGRMFGGWHGHSYAQPDDGSEADNPPIWEDVLLSLPALGQGCDVDQPFEAAYRALVEHDRPGGLNEGFRRDNSLLMLIFISASDDCSSRDPSFYAPEREDLEPIPLRCALNADELTPTEEYIEDFTALVGGDREYLLVSAVAGIPLTDEWRPGNPIERLAELRRPDDDDPTALRPSCSLPDFDAWPPVRLAELVYSRGNNGILTSICEYDWIWAIQPLPFPHRCPLMGFCLNHPLTNIDLATCHLVETLVDDRPCPHPAQSTSEPGREGWQIDLGVELDQEGLLRRRCEVLTADIDKDGCPDGAEDCEALVFNEPGVLRGWYYDRSAEGCWNGAIRYTSRDVIGPGSEISFHCNVGVCPQRRRCSPLERPEEEGCLPESRNCTEASCGPDERCVLHMDEALCGWELWWDEYGSTYHDRDGQLLTIPCQCTRCVPTIGALCELDETYPEALRRSPLLETSACCAEGFHCESGQCTPDRGTSCPAP